MNHEGARARSFRCSRCNPYKYRNKYIDTTFIFITDLSIFKKGSASDNVDLDCFQLAASIGKINVRAQKTLTSGLLLNVVMLSMTDVEIESIS